VYAAAEYVMVTPDGYDCGETMCFKKGPTKKNMHGAIDFCSKEGARVCEYQDVVQLCAEDKTVLVGSEGGWLGDHGVASGGNWDDEFLTWNYPGCSTNFDGVAMQYSEVRQFSCCRGKAVLGQGAKCPAQLNVMSTQDKDVCAGPLEPIATIHAAIGVCTNKGGHVCSHSQMFQLAHGGEQNPWGGITNGWYGDKVSDDAYGNWNKGSYTANNDGGAHWGQTTMAFRCCSSIDHLYGSMATNQVSGDLLGCPAGFTKAGSLCLKSSTAPNNAHGAIAVCESWGSHLCMHNEVQEACRHTNPYALSGSAASLGWYGDHGRSSGGNTDDEYFTWNKGYCTANNDGVPYNYHEKKPGIHLLSPDRAAHMPIRVPGRACHLGAREPGRCSHSHR